MTVSQIVQWSTGFIHKETGTSESSNPYKVRQMQAHPDFIPSAPQTAVSVSNLLYWGIERKY